VYKVEERKYAILVKRITCYTGAWTLVEHGSRGVVLLVKYEFVFEFRVFTFTVVFFQFRVVAGHRQTDRPID
jgi:hypothetical protein